LKTNRLATLVETRYFNIRDLPLRARSLARPTSRRKRLAPLFFISPEQSVNAITNSTKMHFPPNQQKKQKKVFPRKPFLFSLRIFWRFKDNAIK
jgi:hypothetical protein